MGTYPQKVRSSILPLSMTEILPAAFAEWSVTDNTVDHEQSIPHTRQDYVRHARRFAAFLKRPPDTATLEQAIQGQTRHPEFGR